VVAGAVERPAEDRNPVPLERAAQAANASTKTPGRRWRQKQVEVVHGRPQPPPKISVREKLRTRSVDPG